MTHQISFHNKTQKKINFLDDDDCDVDDLNDDANNDDDCLNEENDGHEDDEEEDEEEEDDEDEDEAEADVYVRKKKQVSTSQGEQKRTNGEKETRDELFYAIEEARLNMLNDGVQYGSEMYTDKLTINDSTYMKMYLISVGAPCSKKNMTHKQMIPVKKKTATTYVGSSTTATTQRVFKHNNGIASDSKTAYNFKTDPNKYKWVLCMVLFLPAVLRKYISTKTLRKYWEKGHGCGKIRLGIFLHRYLEIPCYVSEEAMDEVRLQKTKIKMDPIQYVFKPKGVKNINKNLFF